MTVSASGRDVVVAVVGAAVGGSFVAGTFYAALSLRSSQSLTELQRAPAGVADPKSTGNSVLKWIKECLSHISTTMGSRTPGVSKNSADEDANIPSMVSTAQISTCCDVDGCQCKVVVSGDKDQGLLPLQSNDGDQCFWKSGTSPISSGTLKADPFNPAKRTGYLSWDDYFMAIAFLSAQRSKDPNRQVGACLVSQDQIILGIGYNGFPRGCSDDKLPWAKMSVDGDPLKTKYPYVCHAEVNAILNKNQASAAGQRLYVTMFPCNECAKVIIQARIAEVVYFMEKGQGQSNNAQEFSFAASRKLLAMAEVKVWQYKPLMQALVLEYR